MFIIILNLHPSTKQAEYFEIFFGTSIYIYNKIID